MHSQNEHDEDVFYDSLEFVSAATDSMPTGNCASFEAWGCDFICSDYDVWVDSLRSISERRSRFLRKMQFDDMARIVLGDTEIGITSPRQLQKKAAQKSRISDVDFLLQRSDTTKITPGEVIEPGRLIVGEEFELSPGYIQQPQRKKTAYYVDQPAVIGGNKNPRKWKKVFLPGIWNLGHLLRCRLAPKTFPECKSGSCESKFKMALGGGRMHMYQELFAHKGSITSMKFSLDGAYLATGGDDCAVRVWRIVQEEIVKSQEHFDSTLKSIRFAEAPLQECNGHSSDVLDLSWSKSNYLLSSSKDKTVRMWRVGQDSCIRVFQHNDYVTCVQFNPNEDDRFITGSIDGKVRIWGTLEARVVDWVDVGDIITAICYHPDGQGFISGSISGDCHFYSSGEQPRIEKRIRIGGRKKALGKTITGFQYTHCEPEKLVITSADGRVRIYDKLSGVIKECRGLRRSTNQLSASFTADGKFIVSMGNACSVRLWDHGTGGDAAKCAKSLEHVKRFFSRLVAIVSSRYGPGQALPRCSAMGSEAERIGSAAWFFTYFPARVSATWPEEKLPRCHTSFFAADRSQPPKVARRRFIVTAGYDGFIRTFHS
ncbi:uncharacterized protein LOC144705878 isoform X2 [Wolffia australiana]